MVGNVTLQMHCPEQSPQCYQPKHNEEKGLKVKRDYGVTVYNCSTCRYVTCRLGMLYFLVAAEKGYFIFQEPFTLQKPAYSL